MFNHDHDKKNCSKKYRYRMAKCRQIPDIIAHNMANFMYRVGITKCIIGTLLIGACVTFAVLINADSGNASFYIPTLITLLVALILMCIMYMRTIYNDTLSSDDIQILDDAMANYNRMSSPNGIRQLTDDQLFYLSDDNLD
jgi:hypothetical protein